MNPETIAAASDALASLDLEPEAQRHAKLQQDLIDIAGAREIATARRNDIGEELRSTRDPQGDEVAAALLRGESASDAARGSFNRKDLEEESATLTAGLTNLNIRERDTYTAIRNAEAAERAKIAPIFKPLLDHSRAEVVAALRVIVEHYAIARAIAGATRNVGAKEADEFGDVLEAAVRGSHLLPYETVEIPSDVVDLLNGLKGKCSAHNVYVPTSVPNCPEAKFPSLMAAAVDAAARAAA